MPIKVSEKHRNGLISAEGSLDNRRQRVGPWVFYNQSGRVLERGVFVDGRREGMWKLFDYNSGKIFEIFYKDGFEVRRANAGRLDDLQRKGILELALDDWKERDRKLGLALGSSFGLK